MWMEQYSTTELLNPWGLEEICDYDDEDLSEVDDNEGEEIKPACNRCDDRGCNYCLMCSY